MESWLRRIPAGAEFAIVVAAAFGWFLVVSLHAFLAGHWGFSVTNGARLRLVLFEALILLIAGGFLRARGWTLQQIGLIPSWKDAGIGLIIAATVYAITYAARYLLYLAAPDFAAGARGTLFSHAALSPGIVVAVLVVNSLFEEIFASGYVISFLKERFGPVLAINASVTIRLLYHLYQGLGAVLNVVPFGLVFALWYARTRRLWPLVVAHASLNLVVYLHYLT